MKSRDVGYGHTMKTGERNNMGFHEIERCRIRHTMKTGDEG
jgi:hypothetical protein